MGWIEGGKKKKSHERQEHMPPMNSLSVIVDGDVVKRVGGRIRPQAYRIKLSRLGLEEL